MSRVKPYGATALWALVRGRPAPSPRRPAMTVVRRETSHDSLWEPLPPDIAEWMGMDETMPGIATQFARTA